MLGQPVSMLIPEVVGFKLHRQAARRRDGDRSRAHRHRDAAQEEGRRQVRRVLRDRAQSPAARRSRDDRQHGARVRRDDGLLPRRRRDAQVPAPHAAAARSTSRSSRRTRRRRGSSAPTRRPTRCSPTRSSSTSRTVEPSLAGPQAARRTACRSRAAKQMYQEALDADLAEDRARSPAWRTQMEGDGGERVAASSRKAVMVAGATKAATSRSTSGVRVHVQTATTFTLRHGAVVIAAITSCTNTSNPGVMLAAGLLARNAVKKGLTTKPWVKTSLAPGSKVVTDYFDAGRRAWSTSTRSASTSSATAARRASATRARCPTPIAAAIETGQARSWRACSRATATSRGASTRSRASTTSRRRRSSSRTRSPAAWTSTSRASRSASAATARCSCATSGRRRTEVQDEILRSVKRGVLPHAVRGRLQGRRALAGARRPDRRDVRVGSDDSTYVKNPPYFEGMTMQPPGREADRRRAGARACSATRSPPTTSRRPATSPRRAPPGSGSSSTA